MTLPSGLGPTCVGLRVVVRRVLPGAGRTQRWSGDDRRPRGDGGLGHRDHVRAPRGRRAGGRPSRRHRLRQAGPAPPVGARADQCRGGRAAGRRLLAPGRERPARRLAAPGLGRVQRPGELRAARRRPGEAVAGRAGRGPSLVRRPRPARLGAGAGRLGGPRPPRGRRLGDRASRRVRHRDAAGRHRGAAPSRRQRPATPARTACRSVSPTTSTRRGWPRTSAPRGSRRIPGRCSRVRPGSGSPRPATGAAWSWPRAAARCRSAPTSGSGSPTCGCTPTTGDAVWPASSSTPCWGGARKAGAATAYLQVRLDNPGAMALYERAGFRVHHSYGYLRPGDDAQD